MPQLVSLVLNEDPPRDVLSESAEPSGVGRLLDDETRDIRAQD